MQRVQPVSLLQVQHDLGRPAQPPTCSARTAAATQTADGFTSSTSQYWAVQLNGQPGVPPQTTVRDGTQGDGWPLYKTSNNNADARAAGLQPSEINPAVTPAKGPQGKGPHAQLEFDSTLTPNQTHEELAAAQLGSKVAEQWAQRPCAVEEAQQCSSSAAACVRSPSNSLPQHAFWQDGGVELKQQFAGGLPWAEVGLVRQVLSHLQSKLEVCTEKVVACMWMQALLHFAGCSLQSCSGDLMNA